MNNRKIEQNKDDTSGKILDAAIVEFSEKGFSGARVDEIARRAGVNKATIYYHLGDKKSLYATVLQRIFSSVADRMTSQIDAGAGPREKLERFVRTMAETMQHNPYLPSIMLREIASAGANWPDSVIMEFARIFKLLSGVLIQGQDAGLFRETSVLAVHFSTLGPLLFFNRMESKIRRYIQEKKMAPDLVQLPDNIVDTVVENVLNTVLKKG